MPISYSDFEKLDIRVGTVLQAELATNLHKPAIRLQIDFGSSIGVLKSSAQITDNYSPELLIGKQVIAVVNFPPKQIGKFISECLVLGLPDDMGKVVLVSPDNSVNNGEKLH
ncbi:MAG: tRNA-binding protein [Weeksellaceae bacterium]|nr:tRNA-binding protein [Weeksellaceae bacterium]